MTAPDWNNRNFPYPVLSPVNDDYQPDVEFRVDLPESAETNGKTIRLDVAYQNTSAALNDLIARGQAHYCLLIECISTKHRVRYVGADLRQIHQLPAADYAGTFTATPYITATAPITGFSSPEHNPEYAEVKPDGFDIPVGAILAVSHGHQINLTPTGSPYSIIDIVTDETMLADDPPAVETDHDRIRIRISLERKVQVEAIRQHRNNPHHPFMRGLFSSLYMPAIATGIIQLADSTNSWSRSLRQMLERKGINPDDAASDPVYYAQKLMDDPTGQFIQTFDRDDQ